MSTIFADKFKNTSGGNPVQVNQLRGIDTAGSITVQGEGTATTNLQQGIAKVWCSWDGDGASVHDSFNQSNITDTSNTENLVSYTNSFTGIGTMSLHYSSNHNAGGFDQNSSSHLCVYSPNTGSAKFLSISNQNTHYQTMTGHGDLA
tara:strand:- start:864 stop:1304 length:441 start_codon:yes stop_codon:yes gene_type:complete